MPTQFIAAPDEDEALRIVIERFGAVDDESGPAVGRSAARREGVGVVHFARDPLAAERRVVFKRAASEDEARALAIEVDVLLAVRHAAFARLLDYRRFEAPRLWSLRAGRGALRAAPAGRRPARDRRLDGAREGPAGARLACDVSASESRASEGRIHARRVGERSGDRPLRASARDEPGRGGRRGACHAFAIFERVGGVPLHDIGASLSADEARDVVVGALRALVRLHALGRVHGDLKPAHVYVERSADGVVARLIDLGLSRPFGEQVRGGTPRYLAPEHKRGEAAHAASDLYALGVSCKESGLGRRSGDVATLLARCLAPRPGDRPATAEDALGLLGAEPSAVDRVGAPPRVGDPRTLVRVHAALAGARGEIIVVVGDRGAGHSRLVADAVAPLRRAGKPILALETEDDADAVAAMALLGAHEVHDDVEGVIVRRVRRLAGEGTPIVVDGAGAESARTLGIAAEVIRRVGRGALVVVGAHERAAESLRLAGAEVVSLPSADAELAHELMTAARVALSRDMGTQLVEAAGGRLGDLASLVMARAERPDATVAALCEQVLRGKSRRERGGEAATSEASDARTAGGSNGSETASRRTTLAMLDRQLARGAYEVVAAQVDALVGSGRTPPLEWIWRAALADAARGQVAVAAGRVPAGARLDPERRLGLARWLERAGRYDEAITHAVRVASARRVSDALVAKACALLAHARLAKGEPADALAWAERGLAALDRAVARRAAGDANEASAAGWAVDRARLAVVRVDVSLGEGDVVHASQHLDAAMRLAEESGAPAASALVWARRAAVLHAQGEAAAARDAGERAYAAALEAGDPSATLSYALNLAAAECAIGAVGAAIARYRDVARVARIYGREATLAYALVNLAATFSELGIADEAREPVERAHEIGARLGLPIVVAQAQLVRAELAHHDVAASVALADAASAAFSALGLASKRLEAELVAAEAGARSGDGARLAAIDGEVSASNEPGARARFHAAWALCAAARGDAGSALRHGEQALGHAEQAGDRLRLARIEALFARIHEAHGGPLGVERAEEFAGRARTRFDAVAASLPDGLRERLARAASVGAPWSPAPATIERVAPRPNEPPASRSDLHDIVELVRRVLLETDELAVLERAADVARAAVSAERALVIRRRRNTYDVLVARGDAALAGARHSRSVVARVLDSGEPVATVDAAHAPMLRDARSVHDLGLRSILCVPIRSPRDNVAVLYLDHRSLARPFSAEAVDTVTGLASVIGLAFENARLHREAAEREEALRRAAEALERQSVLRDAELASLRHRRELAAATSRAEHGILGRDPQLLRAIDVARRVAPSELPVLIEGASGTGKELLARFVHDASRRSTRPFVAINCGALPETLLESELFGHVRGAFTGATGDRPGVFRAAAGGTVFLDEIAETSPRMQTRLLRVLQEGEVRPVGAERDVRVDVRVVAATHASLHAEVSAGRFREDLYYRLAGVRVVLPPLRERRGDLPLLIEHFLAREGSQAPALRFSPDAMRVLLAHDFPGNVRELAQVVRRAALLAEDSSISVADLGLDLDRSVGSAGASLERERVRAALDVAGGNRTRAASALGVSRVTLHRWIRAHGLGPAPKRGRPRRVTEPRRPRDSS